MSSELRTRRIRHLPRVVRWVPQQHLDDVLLLDDRKCFQTPHSARLHWVDFGKREVELGENEDR